MSKKEGSQLSDEFSKEIKESRGNKNIFGILTAIVAVILIFGTIGLASYQLFFRPEQNESKSAEEKIESSPESSEKAATTPAATTPAATTPAATTPAAANTSATQDYLVVDGDVMGSIATKFNTTVANLKTLNSITDENSLQIGQTLKVPKQ